MNNIKNQLLVIAVSIMLVIVFKSCSTIDQAESMSEYKSAILSERLINDSTLRYSEESPIPVEKISGFKGLKYFPVNEGFKILAYLELAENQDSFEMKTTTDRLPVYRKYGDLHFEFDTLSFMLEIYQNVELIKREGYEDYLFLPFTDETSGDECYGGGRYIDLRIPATDSMEVDFNKAYNPYCNYNDRYSCPVPPPSNHIPIRIEAGEQDFH